MEKLELAVPPRRSPRAVSRRSFVTFSAVALAGTAIMRGEMANAAAASVSRPLGSLDLGEFKRCCGQKFRLRGDLGQTVLELLTAARSGPAARDLDPVHECFMLTFRRVHGAAVSQGTYALSNPSVGRFALFVVPNGDAQRQYYTAVINRSTGV